MINLRQLASRHGLPIDERGQAIPFAGGRFVAWLADPAREELAFVHADRLPGRLVAAGVGQFVYHGVCGQTVVFPARRFCDAMTALQANWRDRE